MCTITAGRRHDGWLVTMNRDEALTRADGEGPMMWRDPAILAPRDPDAGGTWIGVREDGTWALILNGYLDQDIQIGGVPQTRGRLVPLVLGADDPYTALEREDLSSTRAFRLWLGTETGITDFFWDGETLTTTDLPEQRWSFVTSSSLDQPRITALRRDVFHRWVEDHTPMTDHGLPTIHVDPHGLPPEHAIPMTRSYAATQSITQVLVSGSRATMRHWPRGTLSDKPAGELLFANDTECEGA